MPCPLCVFPTLIEFSCYVGSSTSRPLTGSVHQSDWSATMPAYSRRRQCRSTSQLADDTTTQRSPSPVIVTRVTPSAISMPNLGDASARQAQRSR